MSFVRRFESVVVVEPVLIELQVKRVFGLRA